MRNYLASWEPDAVSSEQQIVEAIAQAVALGINYFDTAPGYGEGASERMFGKGIRPFREQVYVATKVTGATSAEIRRSAEASLEHLQVNHIDVLQYHGGWYDQALVAQILAPQGALAGLLQLKAEGLVRFIGFTTEGANGPASALIAAGEFDVMQICYNLIFQHPYDPSRTAGILYEAEQQAMGIVTMRSLTSGIFPRWLQHIFPEEMADPARQKRLRQGLLSFVLSNPLVDSALVGMRTTQEVIDNVQFCLDPALRLDLDMLHQRYV